MFQYQFDNDSGEYAIAKQQAENYPGDDPESRIKGNLGEIAFKKLCQYTLDVSTWHWNNEREVLRGQREYNDYDFAVFGQTVDVKARSRLDAFFSLDSNDVSSDYIVLVWIPPRVTEAVLESDSLVDLSRIHPRNHDPAIVFGFCESEELNSETRTLHHPDPSGPKLSNIPVQPFWQPMLGENLNHVLTERSNFGGQRQIGHWRGHFDRDGERLLPGTTVKVAQESMSVSEVTPENGLIVECLTEPGGVDFDAGEQRYTEHVSFTLDSLTVGLVDEDSITDELREECSRYVNANLYPVISGIVSDDMEIHTVSTKDVSKTGSVSAYS
jgi:hypothetical protein